MKVVLCVDLAQSYKKAVEDNSCVAMNKLFLFDTLSVYLLIERCARIHCFITILYDTLLSINMKHVCSFFTGVLLVFTTIRIPFYKPE